MLTATDGIRFIFDAQGNYLEEINSWQVETALRTPSHHTRRARSNAIKPILDWYQDNDLDWRTCNEMAHMSLMRAHFRSADGGEPLLSKTGWNYRLGYWMRLLRHGLDRGWVEEIGYTLAEGREKGKSEPYIRALLPDEFRELIGNTNTLRLRAGMNCMTGTGIRVGELAALRVRDVPHPNEYRGRAYVPRRIVGKGRKEREIYWPLAAAKSVLHYRNMERSLALENLTERVRRKQISIRNTIFDPTQNVPSAHTMIEIGDPPLWLAESGDPLSEKRWAKEFGLLPAVKGMQVSPHWLRHSYAVVMLSMLIKQQVRQEITDKKLGVRGSREYFRSPVEELRKRLGHSSIETTMVYLDHVAEHRHLVGLAIQDLNNMYLDA